MIAALVLTACLLAPPLVGSASAEAPGDGGPPDSDFGVQLADMFATMADVLAARQDEQANESYLGSAASSRRLRNAISHVASVVVRGPCPFVAVCVLRDE